MPRGKNLNVCLQEYPTVALLRVTINSNREGEGFL